jgi:hypothetical protein
MREEKTMNLQLTKAELKNLIKLAYLGNWMANSWRLSDKIEELDEMEARLLDLAAANGLTDLVDQFEEEGKTIAVPTEELEEELEEMIDFYDDNTFWDQLIHRMAVRDYARKYGEDAVEDLYTTEGMENEKPFIEKYEKEFYENGLDRLELRRDN